MRPRRLAYLLADGARARLIERAAENGHFVTVREIGGEDRLDKARAADRGRRPGRSFQSTGAMRHGVGPEDRYRRAKEEFAEVIAQKLARDLWSYEGVVISAPPRFIGPLRAALADHTVVGEVEKDLTKTPDHELGHWLSPFAYGPTG